MQTDEHGGDLPDLHSQPSCLRQTGDRTPLQIIANIETHGRIVAETLARQNALMESEH